MANNSTANNNNNNNSANLDDQIAYHSEMEHIANRAGDFTKADHHKKMQEIYKAMKEKQQQQLNKTPNQLLDEDYKVAPTKSN